MLTKIGASLLYQAQLQDAKRRWEELQNYLHNVNAEREKLQASKQGDKMFYHTKSFKFLLNLPNQSDSPGSTQQLNIYICVVSELHSQLLAVETEMNNKNKEIQTLHGSLTDAMVSKERLEQRVREMSQHSIPDDSLQTRVQVMHCGTRA